MSALLAIGRFAGHDLRRFEPCPFPRGRAVEKDDRQRRPLVVRRIHGSIEIVPVNDVVGREKLGGCEIKDPKGQKAQSRYSMRRHGNSLKNQTPALRGAIGCTTSIALRQVAEVHGRAPGYRTWRFPSNPWRFYNQGVAVAIPVHGRPDKGDIDEKSGTWRFYERPFRGSRGGKARPTWRRKGAAQQQARCLICP